MRFSHYMNEGFDEGIKRYNKLIHKDCKPYLKLIKNKLPLLRGMYQTGSPEKKSVRQDRKPKGMDDVEANYLNKWLKKNGHIPRNKSVICTTSEFNAKRFGSVCHIFPIGKFNYILG